MNENELTLNEIKESRKHKLKVWLATLGVALFSGLVAVGVFATQSYKKSSAVSYDIDTYYFELDDCKSTETGNFIQYSNLYTYINSISSNTVIGTCAVGDYSSNLTVMATSGGKSLISSSNVITFNSNAYKGWYLNNTYSYPFSVTINESYATDFYNAISLDTDIENVVHEPSLVLSAYDLNNKTYGYFANYWSQNGAEINIDESYLIYDGVRFDYEDFSSSFIRWIDNSSNSIYFDNGRWSFRDGDGYNVSFVHSLEIYSDFIADNFYAPMDTNGFISILDTIVSILTGGIVGVSTGVGVGVSTLVSDIFFSNNALSVMGAMIVIFAGISLAIGLCRWVMNFLTSLGAKK